MIQERYTYLGLAGYPDYDSAGYYTWLLVYLRVVCIYVGLFDMTRSMSHPPQRRMSVKGGVEGGPPPLLLLCKSEPDLQDHPSSLSYGS